MVKVNSVPLLVETLTEENSSFFSKCQSPTASLGMTLISPGERAAAKITMSRRSVTASILRSASWTPVRMQLSCSPSSSSWGRAFSSLRI